MLKRKDLVDVGDSNYGERANEIIECQDCGVESGGTRGDLWQMPMDEVFRCPDCDSTDLALVVKHIIYKIVKE